MGKHIVHLHPFWGGKVIPLYLLDSSYILEKDALGCLPLLHPGALGQHNQVGEDKPPHLTFIPPGGRVDNRRAWFKDLAKECCHVLEHSFVGMPARLMRDKPG